MRSLFIFLVFSCLFVFKTFCQPTNANAKFAIDGRVVGRDTGSVILWYFDKYNRGSADTCALTNGRFHFSGTVNQACEGLLWTDVKNRDFDDSSVIRFLVEPSQMYISYKVHAGSNAVITGSKLQKEKEQWDKQKASLLLKKTQLRKYVLSRPASSAENPAIQNQINRLWEQMEVIRYEIKRLDLRYIKTHPNSYLSAYLLSLHTKKLSLSASEAYFNSLAKNIKMSNLGHQVLEYVYPLTDDNEFRKRNPLIDQSFDDRLKQIESVYQLNLKDTSGNIVSLASFRTKYIVIDFWASWCKPCVENIPSLDRMIKDYQSDSVQFVSISLDHDSDEWKKAILKYHFIGAQLSDSTGFRSIASVYCKVIYVPKYIVADREGRIISYDAPQPTGPKLRTLLDHLLN